MVLVSCPAAVVKVVLPLPVLSVIVPVVAKVPVPVIVLLPLTPNVIPPLAVTLFELKDRLPLELERLRLPEPRARAPEVMPPVALIINELGVPEIVPSVKLVAP